jgi:hypothetical protein
LTFDRAAAALSAVAQIDAAMEWTNRAMQTRKYEAAFTRRRPERILLTNIRLGMRSMPLHHLIGTRFDQMVLFSINTDWTECGG